VTQQRLNLKERTAHKGSHGLSPIRFAVLCIGVLRFPNNSAICQLGRHHKFHPDYARFRGIVPEVPPTVTTQLWPLQALVIAKALSMLTIALMPSSTMASRIITWHKLIGLEIEVPAIRTSVVLAAVKRERRS
jgi:hypothetical protein